MNENRKRIPEFENIRTIFILLLLIHHSGTYAFPDFWSVNCRAAPFIEAFLLRSFFLIPDYFMEVSPQNSGGNMLGFFLSWLVPASVLVIAICYYRQRSYDSPIEAVMRKLVH